MYTIKATSPEFDEVAAHAAGLILDRFLSDSRRMALCDEEVTKELVRQLINGDPPSEGIPDVRPRYPSYLSIE